MRYLLDTNILSALMRAPRGAIAGRIRTVGEENVYTSIVVASELRFGAERGTSKRLPAQVDSLLASLHVAPLETPSDRFYGRLRTQLEHAGTPIGANDMLIAAQALAHGSVLVTANFREFSRVEGLDVENWIGD
jgi:tRNA(fMet)-specific endonuclease VapC